MSGLGLLGAYISDSSSTSDSDSEEQITPNRSIKETLKNPFNNEEAKILPRPSFMVKPEEKISGSKPVENSVFKNPFRVAEDEKRAILEKHVEMTSKQEDLRKIDGKKICWNFRTKGRCRFGNKCTFAHDSDVKVQKTNAAPGTSKGQEDEVSAKPAEAAEAIVESNKRPRKRPGLSDGLVPGKKAMKFHQKVYNQ